MSFNLSETISNVKQARDDRFFSNLLQYAMTDDISSPMPSKTQLWNQYSRLKGGRMSPQDLERFESTYSQVKSGRYQKQLNRLGKLSLGGMSDRKIQNQVKNDPELYQSLLDLVTEGKNSGTEEGVMMAAMGERFLPQQTMADKFMGGDISTGARVAGPLAAGGAILGGQYLMGRDLSDIDSDLKSKRKDLKAEKSSFKDAKLNERPAIRRNVIELQDDIKELEAKRKTAPTRWKSMTGSLPKGGAAGTATGALALMSAPAVGEYLGGEAGREVGRAGANIGLLGMAGHTLKYAPHPVAKLIGAGLLGVPAAMDLYRQYTGDE